MIMSNPCLHCVAQFIAEEIFVVHKIPLRQIPRDMYFHARASEIKCEAVFTYMAFTVAELGDRANSTGFNYLRCLGELLQSSLIVDNQIAPLIDYLRDTILPLCDPDRNGWNWECSELTQYLKCNIKRTLWRDSDANVLLPCKDLKPFINSQALALVAYVFSATKRLPFSIFPYPESGEWRSRWINAWTVLHPPLISIYLEIIDNSQEELRRVVEMVKENILVGKSVTYNIPYNLLN
jgi:hypothetical protein